jgi:hypothetical protein
VNAQNEIEVAPKAEAKGNLDEATERPGKVAK